MHTLPINRAQLPQFLCDILAAPPRHGDGVHQWLYRVARQLHAHRDESEICELLAASLDGCGRAVSQKEIENAVGNSKATAWRPNGTGTPASRPPAQPKWPTLDYGWLKEVIRSGYTVELLRRNSPVPVDDLRTQDVLPALFPGDQLITVGKSTREFCTMSVSECLPWADQCSLIVPSAALKREGLTQKGKVSQHCKEMVGPRQYLVCETDFTHEGASGDFLAYAKHEHGLEPHDVSACIVDYLDQYLPRLAMVVSSGGKSLHGFFNVSDMTTEDPDGGAKLYTFMQNAALVGCDRAGWCRSQFARMPGGTRYDSDGKPSCSQPILFFNPEYCLTR